MQQQGQLGFKIDPDAHYTPRDLQLGLGLNPDAQEHARSSGALRHATVGGRRNRTIVYRGKHILSWLENSGLG